MARTLEKIIDWAGTLPDWQSDAVRRLLTTNSLGDDDKDQIVGMIKARHGLSDTNNPPPKPMPIKLGDVSGVQTTSATVVLKEIDEIKNVNALKDGASIPFGHQGLTIIYGENATGKSGYARVLKRACKARDEQEVIHPNIYATAPTRPASAVFHVQIDGEDQALPWQEGSVAPETLSSICVFDGKCARVIVDEDNEVHYLPFGGQVFEQLVALFKAVRAVLQSEKPTPQKPDWPDIPADTKAGKFMAQLTAATDLQSLGQWTEDDDKELSDLGKRLSQAEIDDPMKIGQRLRNLAGRLRQLASKLTDLEKGVGASVESSLSKILASLASAKQALQAAPQVALIDGPLPGIGSEAWQMLYRAARDYSIQAAYCGMEFPYTGEDGRCVLCMQPLSEQAKERLIRFHQFMEQTAKKAVDDLSKQLVEAQQKLPHVDTHAVQEFKDALDELAARRPTVAAAIPGFVATVSTRTKGLLSAVRAGKLTPIPPLPASPATDILNVASSIDDEAAAIEKTANVAVLSGLRMSKRQMVARKAILSRRSVLDDYIRDLKLVVCYDQCIAETDFRQVTSSGKRMTTEALTPELQKALDSELAALGASHLPLNLRPVASQGETSHRLEIRGQRPTRKLNLTEILSEGEQRVVAIAGFLAELTVAQHHSPIVFDDPVSSLDHKFRSKIAQRLTQEAAKRQVIVFTHDLSLLMELRSNVERFGVDPFGERFGGVSFTVQTVERKSNVPGHITDDLPWAAAPVGARLNGLRQDLAQIKSQYQEDQASYNRSAAEIYGSLRETWEAFVEQTLFGSVVSRHQPEVKTRTLSDVTVTTEDAVAVDGGMTKASCWMTGHDKAKSLDVNRPDPAEIAGDIEGLQDLQNRVKARRKEAKKNFEAALAPPLTAKGTSPCPGKPTASPPPA